MRGGPGLVGPTPPQVRLPLVRYWTQGLNFGLPIRFLSGCAGGSLVARFSFFDFSAGGAQLRSWRFFRRRALGFHSSSVANQPLVSPHDGPNAAVCPTGSGVPGRSCGAGSDVGDADLAHQPDRTARGGAGPKRRLQTDHYQQGSHREYGGDRRTLPADTSFVAKGSSSWTHVSGNLYSITEDNLGKSVKLTFIVKLDSTAPHGAVVQQLRNRRGQRRGGTQHLHVHHHGPPLLLGAVVWSRWHSTKAGRRRTACYSLSLRFFQRFGSGAFSCAVPVRWSAGQRAPRAGRHHGQHPALLKMRLVRLCRHDANISDGQAALIRMPENA